MSADNDSPEADEGTTPPESATEASTPTLPGAPEVNLAVTPVPTHMHIAENDSDDEITAKLKRQGVRLGKGLIAPRVFWPALIIILAVVVLAIAFPAGTADVFSNVQGWIVENVGWYYMLVIGGFVAFMIVLAFSRLGAVKLGREDDEPEFGVLSWFAMLFAAGMGIGLVFYGVGEPLTYATVSPKPGWDGDQSDITGLAMAQTFVHWGLHPWAVYAVIGLALAYAIHRRGRPVSIRWALEPLFGDKVKSWPGDVIDILAIFGTVFGIATSLGLGVQQISAGMQAIGVIGEVNTTVLVILIIVITFLATLSVVSGVGAGIKWLSNINLSLAGLLMITMLIFGPTLFLLRNLVESLGVYLANVLSMTFDVGAYTGAEGQEWLASWTIFYWGWWIAWAPFVGVFIARISRGRTVRQFIAGVLLVPTIVGMIWFSVLGGSGLFRQFFGAGDLVEDGEVSAEGSLFQVLSGLPLGQVLSVIAILLVAIFFITSSDSGSLVVDMLASGGHPNPPTWSRILWAVLEGAVAIALLIAGGLESLQAGSLITALPFSVILVIMCVATVRGLRYERRVMDYAERLARLDRVTTHVTGRMTESIPEIPELRSYIDDRIDYRISRSRPVQKPRVPGAADGSQRPAENSEKKPPRRRREN
ncbi:BCCT family transporter [Paramicrobacterium agarici]|uniref:Choline/glycine/proline betaine transport protein n=1 Tax=Paramicrobacterium agarici TaxID=630514 RepID=A0A2A9DV55_9MICO|nr:choline/glycine/proline betaine transport protein [Microbacterium agarici]TQO23586.1 choline/glycine/proline betaine transport protein [Microbacterium agarici]